MSGKAVGYIRVSTEEQGQEGLSLDTQSARIKAYCGFAGLELVAILEDAGISASIPLEERPAGKRLEEVIDSGCITDVIAVRLDRLWRSAIEALSTIDRWEKKGVKVHFLDMGGNTINSRSASGRFLLTVLAAVAEMERLRIQERTREVIAHKKANGLVYGTVPYGYRREGERLVPDPQEQAVIRRVRELRAEGMSLRRIAKTLESEGYRPRSGGKWSLALLKRLAEAEECLNLSGY